VSAVLLTPDDRSVNVELRSFGVTRADWDYAAELASLHPWVDRMNVAFALGLPPIVLGVARLRRTTLGHYRPGRNGFGLRYEIFLNAWYVDRPLAAKLGTLCHELAHAWQEVHGNPGTPPYHNKEFRQKAASLGLIIDSRGRTQYVPGLFSDLLQREGIDASDLFLPSGLPVLASRTRLRKHSCECPTSFWAAVEISAMCDLCQSAFVLV